jgi:hypothetical protein
MQNVDTIFLIGTIPLRLAWRISTCGKWCQSISRLVPPASPRSLREDHQDGTGLVYTERLAI